MAATLGSLKVLRYGQEIFAHGAVEVFASDFFPTLRIEVEASFVQQFELMFWLLLRHLYFSMSHHMPGAPTSGDR